MGDVTAALERSNHWIIMLTEQAALEGPDLPRTDPTQKHFYYNCDYVF